LFGIAIPGARVVVIFILGDAAHPGSARVTIIAITRAASSLPVLLIVYALHPVQLS